MKEYISVKEACELLKISRQSISYLRKRKIITDFIQVHATCILYNKIELQTLKTKGYGK